MWRKAFNAVLCWLTLSQASGEAVKNVLSSLVNDNVSAESGPRLYRNVPVGVYASAAPYGAYSFHIPFIAAPKTSASRIVPVINNVSGYLRDSYGNRFAEGQTAAYKSAFPQQYLPLQELPAHLAQPLVAAASQNRQTSPHYFLGSQYRVPTFQVAQQQQQHPAQGFSGFSGFSSPFGYAQNYRSLAQQVAPAPAQAVNGQQQQNNNNAAYAGNHPVQQLNNDAKFQRLEQRPTGNQAHHGQAHEDKGQIQAAPATITAVVNGKKTVVNIETKPPVPLLDLRLLEPLTFANPIVPQVQHFLPKISQATYVKPELNLDEAKNHNREFTVTTTKIYGGNVKAQPKKKTKKTKVVVELADDDDIPQQAHPSKKPKTTQELDESPEISYEINSPNHKETYKEKSVSYNKVSDAEPVTYSYNEKTQSEPITYSYTKTENVKPVNYNIVTTKEPAQIKHFVTYKDGDQPEQLIYTFTPEEQIKEQQAESEDTGSAEDTSDDDEERPSNQHSTHSRVEDQPHAPDHASQKSHPHSERESHHQQQNQPRSESYHHQPGHSHSESYHHHPGQPHSQSYHHQQSHPHSESHSHQHPSHPRSQSHHHPQSHHHSHTHSRQQVSPHSHSSEVYHDEPRQKIYNQRPREEYQSYPPHNSEEVRQDNAPHKSSEEVEHRAHHKEQHRQNEDVQHKPKEEIRHRPDDDNHSREDEEVHHKQKHAPQHHSQEIKVPVEAQYPVTQEYEEDIKIIPSDAPAAHLKENTDDGEKEEEETFSYHPLPSLDQYQKFIEHHHKSQAKAEPPQPVHSSAAPVILEKAKRIIIQEESPEEMRVHSEQNIMKEMIDENGDDEEDFEKAYKNAAYGFQAFEGKSDDRDKETFSPASYGFTRGNDDFKVENTPFQEYQAVGDTFPKSTRANYKDARDNNKEDYYAEYSVNQPERMAELYQNKANYYKLYKKYRPEKYFAEENEKKKGKKSEKYTAAPSYNYNPEPEKKQYFAQYKSEPIKYEYSFSKKSPRDRDSTAHASGPFQRYKIKTNFVEPQFQYGFEPIAIPRLLDSELAAMASNNSPESEKPGMRKKIYKENWYIKKTSTSGAKNS